MFAFCSRPRGETRPPPRKLDLSREPPLGLPAKVVTSSTSESPRHGDTSLSAITSIPISYTRNYWSSLKVITLSTKDMYRAGED